MSIDIDTLDDEHEQRNDFRRANGAPLVSDPNDPDKTLRYSRPSSYAKCLDDEEALVNWRMWKAMQGVAVSKALQTQVVACKEDDNVEKKTLRDKAMDKGTANERADQGTGLHAMTVRAEDASDIEFDPPEPFRTDLNAYLAALELYGLVSEMTEVHMVNDDFRAAGTADRIFRLTMRLQLPNGQWLEPGELVCGDLKTGQKLDFGMPNYSAQIALYAAATLYDVVADRRLPTPPINQNWGLLVHLPVGHGRCDVLWVPLDTGIYGAWLAKEVKEWRKRWKRGDDDYDMPKVPAPVEGLVQEQLPGAEVVMTNELVPVMVEYCKARLKTIGGYPDAKQWLLLKWPNGLPSPKQGITQPGDVVRLLELLDATEKHFSIPFLHDDPRIEQGVHRSKVDRSNERGLLASQ